MTLSKTEARRVARETMNSRRAQRQEKERAAREERERKVREREEANENDIVAFLQAEAARAAAVAKYETVMGQAVMRISEREASVSAAAALLSITPSRARVLQQCVADTSGAATSDDTAVTDVAPHQLNVGDRAGE